MTVAVSDTSWVVSEYQTNTSINGGRATHTVVVEGARNNVLPRVTKTERTNGFDYRDRKIFKRNNDPLDEPMYNVMAFLEYPSNADDHFLIGLGSQDNTQADWVLNPPIFCGVGTLETSLSGGESSVSALMEDSDAEFVPGGYVRICDAISISQTIASGVSVGDSVQETAGTWNKISFTEDKSYPKGRYLGSSKVLTYRSGTQESYLQTVSGLNEDESVGTGVSGNTSPTLSALSDATRGIVGNHAFAPILKATCGGVERTVTVGPDGTCSGYCSAGELDLADGTWTTQITWTTAPDDGTDITATYYHKNFSYAGDVVTVHLSDTVPVAFSNDGSCVVSGCIGPSEVTTSVSDWVESFGVDGSYDESTYPVALFNDGAEEDTWTIQFTGATTFSLSGVRAGAGVANGSISTNFSPLNPQTGQPFMTIDKDGWGGTPQTNDYITFKTHPSAFPMILREVVPAATAAVQTNLNVIGIIWE